MLERVLPKRDRLYQLYAPHLPRPVGKVFAGPQTTGNLRRSYLRRYLANLVF